MVAPYQQAGAQIVFWVLVGGFVVGEWVMRVRGASRRRMESWSLLVVVGAVVGAVLAGLGLAQGNTGAVGGDGAWALFVMGCVLMACGLGLRQWAIVTLGHSFTVDVRVGTDQRVVDRGPYAVVRHPSYSGMILFFVGMGFALTNWWALAVLAVLPTAGLIVRIRVEERALAEHLGQPYRDYARNRRRLVPRIW